MSQSETPTIILGAGFVGLFTALHLNRLNYPYPIILIDRNNRFCFKPLLYEYLSGEMESNKVIPLYGELLQGSNILFIEESVESVDLDAHQVHLADGTSKEYGNLVLALGSVPAFFAEGAADNALTFQNQADADRLKQHFIDRLQEAMRCQSDEERRSLLTVVIVGGGPVGVELSLTLGDLLPRWYEKMGGTPGDIRIVLMNRGDILQGDVNSRLRDVATAAMEERQVQPELLLGASVTAVDSNAVEFTRNNQTERLEAGTIIWACGTKIHPLIRALPICDEHRTRKGHLLVKPTLQLLDYPEVFSAGDCAVIQHENPEAKSLPPTAQVAYQEGYSIANALIAKSRHETKIPPCKVGLRGTLMKLGIGTGVANLFDRYEITGSLGQKVRHVTYLELLPTFIHDVKTTLDWFKDDIFKTYTSEYHDIDYTAGYETDELLTLASAIILSAAAVSMAEVGTVSDLLETAALGRMLASATSKYSTNRPIYALFGHQAKRKLAIQHIKVIQGSLEDILKTAIDKINQAIAILAEKASLEEQQEYKEFLFECCNRVAKAGRSGLLGRGVRVSTEEKSVLDAIHATLNDANQL